MFTGFPRQASQTRFLTQLLFDRIAASWRVTILDKSRRLNPVSSVCMFRTWHRVVVILILSWAVIDDCVPGFCAAESSAVPAYAVTSASPNSRSSPMLATNNVPPAKQGWIYRRLLLLLYTRCADSTFHTSRIRTISSRDCFSTSDTYRGLDASALPPSPYLILSVRRSLGLDPRGQNSN